MAYQHDKPHGGKIKGEDFTDPTRASKPAPVTYRNPLTRGLPTLARDDDLPMSGYGRGQFAGPSSVGVKESARLSDFSIAPKSGDPVLDSIATNGIGDRSGKVGSPVSDLERKIDLSKNVPIHPAHAKRDVSSGSPGGTVPGSTDEHATENPVRVPGRK